MVNKILDQMEMAAQRTSLAGQRNELAAERTFSAWIRTGLGGVGGGLALLRFITFNSPQNVLMARIAGEVLMGWGILVMIYALISFHYNCSVIGLERVNMMSRVGVTGIALIVLILSLIIFIMTLSGEEIKFLFE